MSRTVALVKNGRPCRRCGGTERYASNRDCTACVRSGLYRRQPKDLERHRQLRNARMRAWRMRNPDSRQRQKAYRLAYDFGLPAGSYEDLLVAQGGLCAICRGTCPTGRALAIDHDHKTGVVRGLLCTSCNNGLGRLRDSADLCRRAADYLDSRLVR